MRKKLIEVALPLEAINMESAREKSIRHGHPSTLHLWWARRPLAACRAVLWASLVDDPSSWPDRFPTEEDQKQERQRLFDILGRITIETDKKGNTKQVVRGLVSWDDVNDPKSKALEAGQREIARCLAWDRGEEPPTKPDAVREYIAKYAPPAYDPFAGGGSIPLEAQRLGLEAHASDLNPVAVLINKALIEIPPKFRDRVPVNPEDCAKKNMSSWRGAQGLAADVRFYGAWMRERAFERIGHLYPKVKAIRLADGSYQPWSPPHPPAPSPTGGEGEQERWEISDALSEKMTEVARQLRKQETQSEEILWQALRGAKLEGRKFRRQQPIGCFVVDFFCAAERLIVEVDGAVHDSQQELDRERQMLLESLGLRFLRLSAHAVETDLSTCLKQIEAAFTLHSPGFSPLSPRGRGAGGEGAKAEELTVIAWLWARTVRCPNPACGCQMPLVRSFQLSTKKGKEAWVEPEVINHEGTKDTKENLSDLCAFVVPKIRFVVKSGEGKAPDPPKTGRGATFSCLACGQPAGDKHIKAEGMAGRMGAQLMAIVAEGKNGRIYLSPTPEQEEIARSAEPTWYPDGQIGDDRRSMFTPLYGLTHFHHLFTPRQLVALTTFSDLVAEAREKATQDAVAAGLADDDLPLAEGGTGARAYGDAIATYLGFAVDKMTDTNSNLCTWQIDPPRLRATFGRQALPMTWDFSEANIFGDAAGDYQRCIQSLTEVLDRHFNGSLGKVRQLDARSVAQSLSENSLVSTDPPYYDNIGYADLSDYFYVWLRRSLGDIYPSIFSTLLVPKSAELVATPYRFDGDKKKAQEFFEEGLFKTFSGIHTTSNSDFPFTVYYAFKQSEVTKEAIAGQALASTGWETMLEGLIQAGFNIDGTWPMRSELSTRNVGRDNNALASSIVLVCRPRPTDAAKITRRQFLTELKRQLPHALKTLQQGNVAPVDLAQASIGPGMAVFSQYAAVLENDGSSMRVRTALQLINQILDEYLTEQEGEFDGDTRWALTWFEQYQFEPGQYGDAETLSKAKNTSVQGMVDAGILEAKGGKVRLLKLSELKSDWNPNSDNRTPDWEIAQYLIHELEQKGEMGAAALLAKLGIRGEIARDLAYRLYSLCDRKGWTQEALAYNSLVISWPEINRLASDVKTRDPIQTSLL
jgi:putative DNA methylase